MRFNSEVLEVARRASLIGAPTTDRDDMWARARGPAVALAKEVGARLILGDVSTRSLFTTPYASGGPGADDRPAYSDGTRAVSKDELHLLGRDYLVAQLDEAEAQGVDTEAWLGDRAGIMALDRFLELFPIDVLIGPPLDHPSLADRLMGDEIASVRARMIGRVLLIVHDDGAVEVDHG